MFFQRSNGRAHANDEKHRCRDRKKEALVASTTTKTMDIRSAFGQIGPSQNEFNQLVLQVVIETGISFNTLENEVMKKLLVSISIVYLSAKQPLL